MLASVLIASIGGFFYGFDMGIINGVLAMPSAHERFLWANDAQKGFMVSSFVLGSTVSSLFSGHIADRIGRRWSIVLCSVVVIAGSLCQALAMNIVVFCIGRVTGGLAVGVTATVVPIYISEIAPKKIRGRLVVVMDIAMASGIAVSYLLNYGTSHLPGELSFRIPLGAQVLIAMPLLLCLPFFPSSPRWLLQRGRENEARQALARLRGLASDSPQVVSEIEELQRAINTEQGSRQARWNDLFTNGMWRRLCIGVGIFSFRQLSGINAVTYYAPDILRRSGFENSTTQLLATAVFGIIGVVAAITSIFLIDRAGRRKLLIIGALIMTGTMAALGLIIALQKVYGVSELALSYGCLAMLYLHSFAFSLSWGPVPWITPSEIFPQHVRAKGAAVSTFANWVVHFALAQATPSLLASINWGLFVIFAGICLIMALWTYRVVPETRGQSLEVTGKLGAADETIVSVQTAEIKASKS
ncbi:general substrate transporter [Thamnocephalis sphaerospora]|uniref:General substrate transporter n=1 Tax=Thamnocephalis sphaerospora TaxID=78915 RepID=A0A4P9XGD5_9FUNG|nr:general substrate transporter [Thamnocephalis sphaerospora]|eukprot:RKP04686.1 general substrate transporter [Thamnocephalis sphaerospora]